MLSMTTEKKVRLSNNPNGLAWSKDENKFGQKLMEKMGWSKGKGLGANEDGMTEHVKVSLKSDKKGVGCTQEHTNKWLDLQDDYEAILATMNASNSSSGNNCPSQDDDDRKDFIPLVQKSQNTKSRVHYSRFARGKDLSTKAEKDLDCVFGTRAKREEKTASKKKKCEEPAAGDGIPKAEFGVVTTTSTSSVQDYFTQKMAAMKLGKNLTEKPEESFASEVSQKIEFGVTTTTSTTSVQDYFAQKMATMRRAKSDTHLTKMCYETEDVVHNKFSDDTNLPTVVPVEEEIVLEKVSGKKSKKKKKKERQDSSEVKFTVDGNISDKSETVQIEEVKEPVRKYEEIYIEVKETQENQCEQESSSSRKSKKQKRKRETDEGQVNSCEIESTECVKPKMGKRNQETEIMANNDSTGTNSVSSKKRKRSKEVKENQETPCETVNNDCLRVKKRKRSKEVEEMQETPCVTENNDCTSSKIRKRHKH